MVEKRKMDRDMERSEKRRRTNGGIGKDDVKEMMAAAYVSGSIQPKPSSSKQVIHHVLRLDAMGREIDDEGKVVVAPSCLTTLKVNINNKQNKDAAAAFRINLKSNSPNFDPRLQGMGINKNKQQLLRRRPTLMLLVEEAEKAKDELLLNAKAKLAEQRRLLITKEESSISIPNVEWWDVPFLQENMKKKMITMYVEHPRPIEPPAGSEAAPPPPQPLKLTNHERKKLGTQKRVARQKDIQEMMRLGVLEPPKPRLKLTNIMKLGVGLQDPTKVEMEIRRAAAEREQAHMDRNIARKLTPDELRQKKARKLFQDHLISSTTLVSVYKIINVDLSCHPQARFKVDINAQQNRLTGCAAIISDKGCLSSVVVVEGCSKSIKRFGKLMLERIDWTATTDEDEDDDNKSKCVLVWQGSVAQPNFTR